MLRGSKAKIPRKYLFCDGYGLAHNEKMHFLNVCNPTTTKKQLFFGIKLLYLVFFINFAHCLIYALPITNLQTIVWNES